ncbi:hypothetical protein C2869_18290 [Saccharobesus litoralis]|uniref:Uncharacterized protein n=1 Tax=Saccharobesus litoralis TaxID=2172099 RepID=A0A2S0VVJ9_9ALTE|nr:hypothetical protein [Saccharobesus litoralis]AWB68241.1 hypothetical protein C2869_18290 [Saccharobesus litoralis]
MFSYWYQAQQKSTPAAEQPEHYAFLTALYEQDKAKPLPRLESVRKNTALKSGPFELTSGYAEMMLGNGATIQLNAPVKIELLAGDHILLHEGNIRVTMPVTKRGLNISTAKKGLFIANTLNKNSQLNRLDHKRTLTNIYWNTPSAATFDINAKGQVQPTNQPIVKITEDYYPVVEHADYQQNTISHIARNSITIDRLRLPSVDSPKLVASIIYHSDVAAEIYLDLGIELGEPISEMKVNVSSGSGVINLDIPVNSDTLINDKMVVDATMFDTRDLSPIDVDQMAIVDAARPVKEDIDLLTNVNTGFETGDFSDWQLSWQSKGSIDVTKDAAKDGNYGLQINTHSGPADFNLAPSLLPTGFMHPNKRYKLSFDLKRVDGHNSWAGGYAHLSSYINGQYQQTPQGPWLGGSSYYQWMHIEKEILGKNWPAEGTNLHFAFRTPGQEWYMDNIRFVQVRPKPNLLNQWYMNFEPGVMPPNLQVHLGNEKKPSRAYVSKEAALRGKFGLVADAIQGELRFTITPAAFKQQQLKINTDYQLSYDLKVIEGQASLFHQPNTGGWFPTTGWISGTPANGSTVMIDKNGVKSTSSANKKRVKVIIPAAKISHNEDFSLTFILAEGALAYIDFITFAPVK